MKSQGKSIVEKQGHPDTSSPQSLFRTYGDLDQRGVIYGKVSQLINSL